MRQMRLRSIPEKMNQWFFKITDYAEELLNGIDALDLAQNQYKSSDIMATMTQGFCYAQSLDCDCVDSDCGQHGGDDCNDCS